MDGEAGHPIEYRPFARALSSLPLSATCGDLMAMLQAYRPCEPSLKERMIMAVEQLGPDAEWLWGLFKVCDVLKEQNSRFLMGVFADWSVESQ